MKMLPILVGRQTEDGKKRQEEDPPPSYEEIIKSTQANSMIE